MSPFLLRRFILLFIILLPCESFAQSGDTAHDQLTSTADEIKALDKRQKHLAEENSRLQQELKALQKETVSLARSAGDQEKELSGFEEKLFILEDQKKQKKEALNLRQGELSALISAMVKLRAMPPEAVIAMPGKLDETLAVSRALSIVTHTIKEDSDSLQAQLHELDDLENKIHKNREAIASRKKDLELKRNSLADKIKERSRLQEELNGQAEKEKARLAQLTAKSHNLQDLIDALGKSETVRRHHEEDDIKASSIRKEEDGDEDREIRSFVAAKGRIRLPASGKIVRHYGGSGEDSALSRGITLETRESASVVAPFDGEVVYAGSFRDYGHMIIIRHSDDYHTLLSGMEHIHCAPGQFLMEGEPIGTMGHTREERRLYMEVRKSSRPIDPMPWLKGV